MSIRIKVSDTVRIACKGTIADVNGPQPFDFSFLAKRLDEKTLAAKLGESDSLISDFLASIVTGWSGVKDDNGEVPFSEDALRELMLTPGLSRIMFRQYLEDCGAKAKN